MKHKTFTITYYHSNLIDSMLFDSEADAEEFDNVLSEYISNPEAIKEFKAPSYASLSAVEYAIENGTFLEHLDGEYSNRLLDCCEKMVDGYNGATVDDCYILPLKYIFNKIYNK